MAKRLPISLLCLTLTFQAPVQAAPTSPDPEVPSALALFEERGVFKDSPGKPDPLRGFVHDERSGRLTAIGELLFRSLSAERPSSPAAGPADVPEQARASAALAALGDAVSRGGTGAAARSALLEAGFDGSIVGEGVVAVAEGVAGPAAPAVPGQGAPTRRTGGSRGLEGSIRALERGLELDRLMRVAELLGERYRDDRFLEDESDGSRLKEALLRRGARPLDDIPLRRRRVYDASCGGYVGTVLELVDCRLAGRRRHIERARRSVQNDGRLAARHIALAVLEALRFHASDRVESLGYEVSGDGVRRLPGAGPEARSLREALESAPLPGDARERYKDRAADLALRLRRLLTRLARLEACLGAAERDEETGRLHAELDAVQEELEETGLDHALFTGLPALAAAAGAHSRGLTPAVTRWGALLGGGMSRLWGGGRFDGYLADREDIGAYTAVFSLMAERIADGDFEGARARLVAAEPEAIRTHPLSGLSEPGDDCSQGARVRAAWRRVQGSLGRVAEVHVYSGIAVHLGAWSLTLAAAAPAAGLLLSGAAEGCFAGARAVTATAEAARVMGLARTALALRGAAFVPRASGLVLEHAALRLASLSPAPARARLLDPAARLGAFSLLACGGASGAASAVLYGADRAFGDGASPMGGPWEAFRTGYLEGAGWSSGSSGPWWAPLLLFAGVPSNVWAGTPAAGAADTLAMKGLVGSVLAAVRRVPGLGRSGGPGLEAWARTGGWKERAGAVLGAGDQLAKYAAVSRGAGSVAEGLAYRFDAGTDDPQGRIRRAREAGERHAALPYWLLLPVFPAAHGAGALAARRGAEGYLQYREAGELGVIARPEVESASLPLRRAPRGPLSLRLFDAGRGDGRGLNGPFVVTRELRRSAVRRELSAVVPGPLQLYELSRRRGGTAGRLRLDRETRDQAHALFERAVARRPDLALRVLQAAPGELVEGFGTARPPVQREIARVVYLSRASMPRPQVAAAERVLGPYLRTERAVDEKARAYLALRAAMGPGHHGVMEAASGYVEAVQARLRRLGRSGSSPGRARREREALFGFLRCVAADGTGARRALRAALLESPDGEGALLAYEGLLPLAQAEASAAGETVLRLALPGRIEARARAAYRGLGRLGDLQIAAEEVSGAASGEDLGAWGGWRPARDGPVAEVLRLMRADMSPLADSSVRASLGARTLPAGWEPQRVILALRRRLDGVGTPELAIRHALRATRTFRLVSRLPGLRETRLAQPLTPYAEGLTRRYARELLAACWRDPSLPTGARWALFWRVLPSVFAPRGSWVEARLFEAARGRRARTSS